MNQSTQLESRKRTTGSMQDVKVQRAGDNEWKKIKGKSTKKNRKV